MLRSVVIIFTGARNFYNLVDEKYSYMDLNIALIQYSPSDNPEKNVEKAKNYITQASSKDAEIVLLQELFDNIYFPKRPINTDYFNFAQSIDGPTIKYMCKIAREFGVYLVVPIFEEEFRGRFYNTAVVIDSSGNVIGKYRKNHIPQNLDADEKYYFSPGNLGFPIFNMPKCQFGIIICADRHFPETFRTLALKGAEIIFVPSAIGLASMKRYWEIELCGAALANMCFVAGVNQVGGDFWGNSLVSDPSGTIIARAGENEEVLVTNIDLEIIRKTRISKGWFRDLRPEIYFKP